MLRDDGGGRLPEPRRAGYEFIRSGIKGDRFDSPARTVRGVDKRDKRDKREEVPYVRTNLVASGSTQRLETGSTWTQGLPLREHSSCPAHGRMAWDGQLSSGAKETVI
jgi:hypothetical protein